MKIKLENKSPFFFIKDVIHLTYENPGPLEVDLSKLSDQHKQWLLNGVKSRTISIDEEISIQPPAKTVIKDKAPVLKKERPEEAIKFLKEINYKKLITAIDEVQDIAFLKILKETESLEKSRAKIIEAIDLRLKELQDALAKKIGIPEHNLEAANLTKADQALLNLLEEEAGEQIIIEVGK